MFNSTVLEVAIGLCFTFGCISLIASALNEALASAFKWRAGTLLEGVKSLLNDDKFEGLARDLYNHGLVNPRSSGEASTESELTSKPSYIPAKKFSLALIEHLQGADQDFAALGDNINKISNPQLKKMLRGMYDRADNKIENMHKEVAEWFDNGMERVSGAYKRRSQLVSFCVALSLAILLNVDAVYLFKALWQHPTLTAKIGTVIPATQDALAQLTALPIGWGDQLFVLPAGENRALAFMIFGWLLTASSAMFGAPFWFEALQKLVNMRGSGKSADKKDDSK